jgi:DNA-binding protein H-NS
MARPKSLAKMSLEALIDLRDSVTTAIGDQAESLRAQLANLTGGGGPVGNGRRRGRPAKGSKLKGRKIAPKYRDKSGNAWSGRGAVPRWMRDAIKGGARRDDFLIGKGMKGTKAAKATKRRAPKKRKVAKRRKASKPAAAQAA